MKFHPTWKSREVYGPKHKVNCMGWSCDGARLAVGQADGYVQVYSIAPVATNIGEKSEAQGKAHEHYVTHLAWHPSSPDTFATIGGKDRSVRLWQHHGSSFKQTKAIEVRRELHFIAFHPEGTTLLAGSADAISIIDLQQRSLLRTHKFSHDINDFGFSKDGSLLYVCAGHVSVEVLSWPSLKLQWRLDGHVSHCETLAVSPDGRHLAVGGNDAMLTIWDLARLVCCRTLPQPQGAVKSISWSHDSEYVAFADDEHNCEIVKVDTGEQDLSAKYEYNAVPCFNPSKPVLALCGTIWRINDPMQRQALPHGYPITITAPAPPPGTRPPSGSGKR